MSFIEEKLRIYNPFSQGYMMMKEVIDNLSESQTVPEVKMLFSLKPNYDSRVFNIPKSNEVCAIIVMDSNDNIPPANIVVHEKGSDGLINLYPLDPNVEPLTYPLLYPKGNLGWSMTLKDKKIKVFHSVIMLNIFYIVEMKVNLYHIILAKNCFSNG